MIMTIVVFMIMTETGLHGNFSLMGIVAGNENGINGI